MGQASNKYATSCTWLEGNCLESKQWSCMTLTCQLSNERRQEPLLRSGACLEDRRGQTTIGDHRYSFWEGQKEKNFSLSFSQNYRI